MKKWKSIARCAEGMLSNLAVIGIGLGIYEQKWWPAIAVGAVTGVAALFIAWRLSDD